MHVIVCVKQVPSSNKVSLDPITHTIIREGKSSVINPYDLFGLEQAVELKERHGGQVSVLSMGIPDTEKLLREAISRGGDLGMLLTDRQFAGSDTLATAYTLSKGIKQLSPYHLIICGKMAIDGDTGQIGPELAEILDLPHLSDVIEILESNENSLMCKKKTDWGTQVYKITLPAVITLEKDINMPRLPSIEAILKSEKVEIKIMDQKALKADPSKIGFEGSPTQVVKTFIPEKKTVVKAIQGTESQQAKEIMGLIEEVWHCQD